jgi:hypothetical protein
LFIKCLSIYEIVFFCLQSQALSFSEVSKIRAEVQLPTADDIVAHLTNRSHTDVELKEHHNGSSIKKAYVFNGTVPSNPLISILEDKLRPYIFHFLDSV